MYWGCYTAMRFASDGIELVQRARAELRATRAAWHDPEYYHLTLCFLGWLARDDGSRAADIVARFAPEAQSLELQCDGGLTILGHGEGDRYIALEIKPDEPLLRLQRNLFAALTAASLPVKEQTFTPHISLGRVPHGMTDDVVTTRLSNRMRLRAASLDVLESLSAGRPIHP